MRDGVSSRRTSTPGPAGHHASPAPYAPYQLQRTPHLSIQMVIKHSPANHLPISGVRLSSELVCIHLVLLQSQVSDSQHLRVESMKRENLLWSRGWARNAVVRSPTSRPFARPSPARRCILRARGGCSCCRIAILLPKRGASQLRRKGLIMYIPATPRGRK